MMSFARILSIVLLLATVAAGDAQPSGQRALDIRPAATQTFAVRGGVLMLPLTAGQPGSHWPSWLTITLADGSSIEGQIAWVEPTGYGRSIRGWSVEAESQVMRRIEQGDSTATDPGTPILLADLPIDGSGDITVSGVQVRVNWLDPPTPFASGIALPDMPRIASPNRPDATSPFAHWRWVLLGERVGAKPPPLSDFTELEQMVAQAITDLWLVGMRRLEAMDQQLAGELRSLLTYTSVSRRGEVAGWVTRSASLNALLSVLLNPRTPPTRLALNVQSWIEDQAPVLVWPTQLFGSPVRIAVMNRRNEPIELELAWVRGEGPAEKVHLRAGELREFAVHRPTSLEDQAIGEDISALPLVLDVRFGVRRSSIQFPPVALVASPPGVELRGLHLPLALADVEAGQQPVVDESHATFVHIRRRSGRWEVFFECRRPPGVASQPRDLPVSLRNPEDLLGHEAITLLLGRDDRTSRPNVMLVIPEQGWWTLPVGGNDGTLQIHRRSYEDRWLCRVVLPRGWIGVAQDAQLRVAFSRTHGDNEMLETGPGRITSWQIDPARLHVDLSQWDD